MPFRSLGQLQVTKADYFTYAVSFLLVFVFCFLPKILGATGETAGMYIIVAVFMSLVFVAFSVLFYRFVQNPKFRLILVYCLLIFLVSEVVAACVLGDVALFGIFQQPVIYNGIEYPDVSRLRKTGGFGFSMSFLIAATVCLLRKCLAYLITAGNPSPNN